MTNLKRIRRACKITQKELASRAAVNIRMIQHYEQRQKDINAASALTVYRIARTLGSTVEELLELETDITT